MKILYNPTFTNQFAYPQKIYKGGMEKADNDLICALLELGHEVELLVSVETNPDDVCLPIHISNCHQLVVNGQKKNRNWNSLYKQANQLVKKENFDLFYTNNMLVSKTFLNYPELASKTINVLHCYQPDKETRIKTIEHMDFVRLCGGKTMTVSNHNQYQYLKDTDTINYQNPFSEPPLLIHWFDHDFRKTSEYKNRRYILISRNSFEKRLQFAINLADRLQIGLDIFTTNTDGLYFNSLDNVTTFKNVEHWKIMDLLKDYKAMIHPSTIEASPICIFEAASYGLPIIHQSPGAVEYLTPLNNLFCNNDTDYEKFINMFENDEIELSSNVLQASMKRPQYTWDEYKIRIDQIFQ